MVRPSNDGVHLETPQAQTTNTLHGLRRLLQPLTRNTLGHSFSKYEKLTFGSLIGGVSRRLLWYANAHADPDSETPDHSACMRALRIRI